MIKLYHNDMSVCAQKVRLVLDYKKIDWQSQHLNLRAGDQFNPDFLRVNPKAVVPVLQHNQIIVTESNAIVEYLEEVSADFPLMPEAPALRAEVRNWLRKFDAGLHEQVAVISFCIAFRFQLLQRYPSAEALSAYIGSVKDPGRAEFLRDVLANGLASDRLQVALYSYQKLLEEMAVALAQSDWLVGNQLSLADFALLPYIERLEQLQLGDWWQGLPVISDWLTQLRAMDAYRTAINDWFNQPYIELMAAKGREAWPALQLQIAALGNKR